MGRLPAPPPAARGDEAQTLHGERIADPYRWLERDDAETRTWTEAQNARTRAALDAGPERALLASRLRELPGVGPLGGPGPVGSPVGTRSAWETAWRRGGSCRWTRTRRAGGSCSRRTRAGRATTSTSYRARRARMGIDRAS